MRRLNYFRFLAIAVLIFSATGCTSGTVSSPVPTKEFSKKNTFGDGYVAHVPIADVKEKDPKEIVNILMTQWLEHCKTENAYPDVQIKDYRIGEITIISVNDDNLHYITTQVMFSIVPVQSPNEWGAAVINFDDPWLNLGAVFGVFKFEEEGPYYWLEATPARG